jgi:hypothetical protein
MDDSKFDVYYGDGMKLHRQTFSIAGPTGTGTWTNLASDHDDPSDIAFDLDHRVPALLASDGGVHRTVDQGASWTLTGGGYGGFDALQITEVTGQSVAGSSLHLDLYYGTQDNDIKASSDSGHSWIGSICCEGRFIRTAATSIDHQGSRVTGSACGPCVNFVADPHFQHIGSWPNAPDGNPANLADAPFLIAGDAYLQYVANQQTVPPSTDFYLTLSAGASWSRAFSLPLTPKGPSVFAGPPANPTMYQGVQRPGSLPNGGLRLGLIRARNLMPPEVLGASFGPPVGIGQVEVTNADSSGIGAFGSLRTPIARYVVFGVDPNNADRLIAPDVENSEMKFSADGGANWYPLPQLTQAVTDSGKYLFALYELSLASVIAWDPYDSCHILVGTIQNGVIRSTDGGITWTQIEGSTPVTYVSSFYFPPKGPVWVSTNGRGLWKLDLDRKGGADSGRCRVPSPPPGGVQADGLIAIDPTTGSAQVFRGLDDPAVCARCSVILVRNGWVTDLQLSDGTVQEVAISGGTISQLDPSGREIPLAVPNVYQPGEGKFEGRIAGSGLTGSQRVRGLVLEGSSLRLLIAAKEELPFAPPRVPMVFVFNAGKTGGPYTAQSGESVRVIGTNFLPSTDPEQGVRILFDREVVAQRVQVRADGSFSVEISVHHLPGEVVVTVEQRDGRRLTLERATIDVVARDLEEDGASDR